MTRTARFGIRTSTVLSATVALAIALLSGALILRTHLRDSLYSSIADQTITMATGVAALVATGDFTSILDSAGPNPGWIQVVDDQGVVVASTANVARLRAPFAPIVAGRRSGVRTLSGLVIDTGERVSVATVSTSHGRKQYTVLAASPLDIADASDRRIVTSLLVVFPALLLVSGLTVWLVVRRALHPVDAIRAEVAAISSSDLSRRVPLPGTRDEINRLAVTMNDMLDRLQTSIVRQQRFVGDASHELRSPLASLRNQLEVSTIDNRDPRWADSVADMIADHDRLERLIRDLLLLARHDDHAPANMEPVDLGYLVRTELARRPGSTGIERSVEAENCLISGDADALARILRNLVDNAERHAHHHITIRVHSIQGAPIPTAELVVEDDGEGIPEQYRSTVFERFRRLDDARATDAGGSGLGLAIVADLVHAHHGTVQAEAGEIGARLVVRIPALVP